MSRTLQLLLVLCVVMCSCQQGLEVETSNSSNEIIEGQIVRLALRNGRDSVSARKSSIVSSDDEVASVIEKGKRFYVLAHRPGVVELIGSFEGRQSAPMELTVAVQVP
jgi:hypothetical protein